MGAFFLSTKKGVGRNKKEVVTALFEKQGFTHIVDLSSEDNILIYCGKINVNADSFYVASDQNFCVITGTLIYKKLIDQSAAKQVFEDFRNNRLRMDELYGNFSVVISLNGNIKVYTDAQGVYSVWHDANFSCVSSSFIAVTSVMDSLTINDAAVYEYVFQEATFGGDTVVNEVSRLKVGYGLECGMNGTLVDGLSKLNEPADFKDVATSLECSHAALFNQFEAITHCFSENIDSALSGGYDSRLLLALCREQGITPHLHVYGKENDADVIVAKTVCAGESIQLAHKDKSSVETVSPEQFKSIVEQNFYSFQGTCPDGILDNGADLLTRQQRTQSGRLLLNGGGGEVFRNFFYLPNKKYTALNILWSFYSRFDPATCSESFGEQQYYRTMERKVYELIGREGGELSRQEVEYLYAGFRCTYWMGANNAINNQFGYFLTPFVEDAITKTALNVPIKYKNHGLYQASLINKVSPELAKYMSDYGHNFSDSVPIKRKIKDYGTLVRPTLLRKYTYRLKKHSNQQWPYFIGESYIQKVLPLGWNYMHKFFNLGRVLDAGQYKRIATLEYFFQKLDVNVR